MTLIEKLSCHLPYGVKVIHNEDILEVFGLDIRNGYILNYAGETTVKVSSCKPILRPMSDYKTSDADILIFKMFGMDYKTISVLRDNVSFGIAKILFKHHFDVFNMIETGEAVSIHQFK